MFCLAIFSLLFAVAFSTNTSSEYHEEDLNHDVTKNLFACPSGRCENGGSLVTRNDSSTACRCSNFFEGRCCSEKRCFMGTLCVGKCVCPKGYKGDHCEKFSCGPGSSVYSNGDHFCQCPPTRQGPHCQHLRCLNGGTLHLNDCMCRAGFYGKQCEMIVCAHGDRKACASGQGFYCSCHLLHTGQFCDESSVGVICILILVLLLILCPLLALGLFYAKQKHYGVPVKTPAGIANPKTSESDSLLVGEPTTFGRRGSAKLRHSNDRPVMHIRTNPSFDR